MNPRRSYKMYTCIFALPSLPPVILLQSLPGPPPSFIHHPSLPPWRRWSTMPRRYPLRRRWSTPSHHHGSSAWMLGLYVWSITANQLANYLSLIGGRRRKEGRRKEGRGGEKRRRERREGMAYLKSCMKWQIGHATSLYLCVERGITGYSHPFSQPSINSPHPHTLPENTYHKTKRKPRPSRYAMRAPIATYLPQIISHHSFPINNPPIPPAAAASTSHQSP